MDNAPNPTSKIAADQFVSLFEMLRDLERIAPIMDLANRSKAIPVNDEEEISKAIKLGAAFIGQASTGNLIDLEHGLTVLMAAYLATKRKPRTPSADGTQNTD